MNRRSVLTAIAAIPFVGHIVPVSAEAAAPRYPVALSAVRDLLWPGLRMELGGVFLDHRYPVDGDIIVDIEHDRLIVIVAKSDIRRVVKGFIERSDIADRSYIGKFRPMLVRMAELLNGSSDAIPCEYDVPMETIT